MLILSKSRCKCYAVLCDVMILKFVNTLMLFKNFDFLITNLRAVEKKNKVLEIKKKVKNNFGINIESRFNILLFIFVIL